MKAEEFASSKGWIITYTGKKFHLLKPKLEEIDIIDIAHALSLTCRFGGHTSCFYSVDQHCVSVACGVETQDKRLGMAALLHDAAEAYLGDMVKPFKVLLPFMEKTEYQILKTIYTKYNVDINLIGHNLIKTWDRTMVLVEASQLMTVDMVSPRPEYIIYPDKPRDAEEKFLMKFEAYKDKEKGGN